MQLTKIIKSVCLGAIFHAIVFLIAGILIIGTVILWSHYDPVSFHFDKPLPPSAKLERYSVKQYGIGHSYFFLFKITDDVLMNQIVSEWNLSRMGHPRPFEHTPLPKWWKQDDIDSVVEKYGRIEASSEHYWSIWIDRKNNYLYAEYGKW